MTTTILLGLFIVGAFLRLQGLGTVYLWHDELCTIERIKYSLVGTISHLGHSGYPPLHYMILKPWTMVFGISPIALRFPSFVFSCLSIPCIYKLGKELFNEEVGIISSLLLSFSPYAIIYARDAKMYAMFWFFTILSFAYFYKFIKKGETNDLLAYVIVTFLSAYTLYTGFLFIIIQNLIFFIFFDRHKKTRWIQGQLGIILLYIFWLRNLIFEVHQMPAVDAIPPTGNYIEFIRDLFLILTGNFVGRFMFWEAFFYSLLLSFVFIQTMIMFGRYRKNDTSKLPINCFLLLFWIFISVAVFIAIDHFIAPLLRPRFLGFLHIPLILLFSFAISQFQSTIKKIVLACLIITTLLAHLLPYYIVNKQFSGEDWRTVSIWMKK